MLASCGRPCGLIEEARGEHRVSTVRSTGGYSAGARLRLFMDSRLDLVSSTSFVLRDVPRTYLRESYLHVAQRPSSRTPRNAYQHGTSTQRLVRARRASRVAVRAWGCTTQARQ